MYSTVKPHLPLITNRVEFQLTSLPPPPTISLRQDFGRRVRSPIYRITPYVRSLSPKFNASMPNIMGRYGDSDSDISGTFSLPPDIKLRSTSSRGMKIPKPPGEAGRKNSGGFNLEQELGWTQAKYVELMNFINEEVKGKLDIKKPFSKQRLDAILDVIKTTAETFNISDAYVNDWPIREALKLRLKYLSESARRKGQRNR